MLRAFIDIHNGILLVQGNQSGFARLRRDIRIVAAIHHQRRDGQFLPIRQFPGLDILCGGRVGEITTEQMGDQIYHRPDAEENGVLGGGG